MLYNEEVNKLRDKEMNEMKVSTQDMFKLKRNKSSFIEDFDDEEDFDHNTFVHDK